MAELSSTTEPYVFLSYASAERDRALAVAAALQQAGIASWLDRHAIAGGAAWSAAIVDGITGCAAFVVLGSARAFRSPNVQRELNLAVEENRPLLPLLLERTEQPREVRYALAGRQWVELLDRPADAWLPDVLRALAGLGLAPTARVAAVPPVEPVAEHLPTPLTSFIGREPELAEVTSLLGTTRLLTLTGPGGTGKTRLAIAAAHQVAAAYPDSAWFVDLSGVADPAGVIPAIALALDVRESEGRSLGVAVATYLRRKQLLLVLDNFEQVVAASMTLYDLLTEAPGLALLVTSRVLLRLAGEQEYAVPPLPLPEERAAATRLRQNPAVQLFLDRARALRPDLARSLTDETAQAIAAICQRLDGLPLAIELAAARVKLLPPVQLLARLERRLPLLAGGIRSLPARQQTLRATIAWSWDLLREPEQMLFRRLGVFAGSFSLEAAEAVCNPDGELDVLEGLAALVDQSLVHQQDDPSGAPRFRLLATLQEYALEQLETTGEATALRLRHAEYYCTLAETGFTAFWQRGRYATIAALLPERDNFLIALPWLLAAGEGEIGLRLAAGLQPYWYFTEPSAGLRWVETFLAQASGDVPQETRGIGHLAAAIAANAVGEFGVGNDHAERASALLRGTAAQADLALALSGTALVQMASDAPRARLVLEEARRLAQAAQAEHLIGVVAYLSALALLYAQLPAEALPYNEEALRIGRRLDAEWLTAASLASLSMIEQLRGDLQAAHGYLTQALPLCQLLQDRLGVAHSLTGLAFCAAASGEADAIQTWRACLTTFIELGNRAGMVAAVLGIAARLAARGDAIAAARLVGAVEAKVAGVDNSMSQVWAQPLREQALALARAALSAEAFAQAWTEGEAFSLDQATDLALAELASLAPGANPVNGGGV